MEEKTKYFIGKAKKTHGNKYDYSLVEYKSSREKVKIICKNHGEFEQQANSHLQGKKCMQCSIEERSLKRKNTKKEFINKAIEIHGKIFDYSKVDYVNNKTKIKIICKNHGEFEQRPDCHLFLKHGCPKCGGTSKVSLEEFKKRANDRHDGFFNYSAVTFNNITDKVEINCPKHGPFIQGVKAHLDGNACPNCKTSKLENKILKEIKGITNEIRIKQFYKSAWLERQHIDIFLLDFNIAIECHGIQHYEVIEKFGGEPAFKKRIELDSKKRKLCAENNIELYEIPYFYNKSELNEVLQKIKNKIA